MRIIATFVCTLLFSLALPSPSFAASNCNNAGSANAAKNCVKNNNDQKSNCNGNGNCDKAKNAKDKADDHAVSCMEINNMTLRRQCLDKRRD
jgi:hypothetical protein